MAQLVDEKTYDEAKTDGGASAKIYGVPVGANYSDFQKKSRELLEFSSKQVSTNIARSLLWTGLGASGLIAYTKCLELVSASDSGDMVLFSIGGATETDVTLKLRWKKSSFGPSKVDLAWQASDELDVSSFPKSIADAPGWASFLVKRPSSKASTLYAVNAISGGTIIASNDILVARYSPPPPTPPPVILHGGDSWTGVYEIVREIPQGAFGRIVEWKMHAVVHSSSSSSNAWLEFSVFSVGGWEEKCRSQKVYANGDFSVDLVCTTNLDNSASKFRVVAQNGGAEPISVSVQYSY